MFFPKLLWHLFNVLFNSKRGVGETDARVAKCSMITERHKQLHTPLPPPTSFSYSSGFPLSRPVLMLITAAEALNVMSVEGKSLATCGESLRCCHTLSCL